MGIHTAVVETARGRFSLHAQKFREKGCKLLIDLERCHCLYVKLLPVLTTAGSSPQYLWNVLILP